VQWFSGSLGIDETAKGKLSTSAVAEGFSLNNVFTPPVNLSANGVMRVRGSRRYWEIQNGVLTTVLQPGGNNPANLNIALERQPNNGYKIKFVTTNQYLHLEENGTLSTRLVPNLDPSMYEFNIIEVETKLYKIQSRWNDLFLMAAFDVVNGVVQQGVRCAPNADDDYWLFELRDAYTPEMGEDLSGEWFMRNRGSDRYFGSTDNGMRIATVETPVSWVIKPRYNNQYQILTRNGQQKLVFTGGSFRLAALDAQGEDRFRINRMANQEYSILLPQGNGMLYEFFDVNLSLTNFLITIGAPLSIEDAVFMFSRTATGDVPAPVFNSAVMLRSRATHLNWAVVPGRNNISLVTDNQSNLGTRFVFRYRRGGEYEIWSQGTSKRYSINPGGLLVDDMISGNSRVVISRTGPDFIIRESRSNWFLSDQLRFASGEALNTVCAFNESASEERTWLISASLPVVSWQNDLTGNYEIRVAGNNRTFKSSGNVITTSTGETARLYLRRMADGKYEIWNTLNGQKCSNNTSNLSTPASPGRLNPFEFLPAGENQYRIINGLSNLLRENTMSGQTTGMFANVLQTSPPTYQLRFHSGGNSSIDRFILKKL
jgi:hypothetical protein